MVVTTRMIAHGRSGGMLLKNILVSLIMKVLLMHSEGHFRLRQLILVVIIILVY